MSCEEPAAIPATPPAAGLHLPPGVPPLRSLYLYIAGSCNLACRHCWIEPDFKPDRVNGRFVHLDHLEKAVREAKPLGLKSVKLTGGEPLLHPEIRKILTLCAAAGVDILLETNGVLLDDDLAHFMKGIGRVRFVSVSVDGSTPEVHDKLRGVEGSHEAALSGIRALVGAGYRPQLICTLHRGNIAQMEELVRMADELGCGSIKFNHVQRVGRGTSYAVHEGLEAAEILALFRSVENALMPRFSIRIHFDIPMAFYPIRKLLHDSLSRCSIHGILGMLSGGELALCGIGTTVPELIYGHIATDDLRMIWCESPGLVALRKQVPERLEGICGRCLHRDMCQGSCVAQNYHINGRLNEPHFFCNIAEKDGIFPKSRNKEAWNENNI